MCKRKLLTGALMPQFIVLKVFLTQNTYLALAFFPSNMCPLAKKYHKILSWIFLSTLTWAFSDPKFLRPGVLTHLIFFWKDKRDLENKESSENSLLAISPQQKQREEKLYSKYLLPFFYSSSYQSSQYGKVLLFQRQISLEVKILQRGLTEDFPWRLNWRWLLHSGCESNRLKLNLGKHVLLMAKSSVMTQKMQ